MSDVLPFGIGAWFFVAMYLCSLLLIGWIGYNARREDTLRDFYLAGRGFGFFVLFLREDFDDADPGQAFLYTSTETGQTLL